MPVSPALANAAVPASPATEYRPAIDGLRAVAVLAVFLFHLDRRWLPGGFFGVDIFFVISGYLITAIVLRNCERGHFSFGRFYQRRIARLLPAFVVVAVATLIGAAVIYSPQDLASAGATLSAAAGSAANLKFLLQGNYFALSPDSQPFLHCWSLSVEEQFYLLFPAAFFLLYRKTRTHRVHVLAGLCGLSFLSYVALNHARPEWAFYLLPARAWELLAGSMLADWRRQAECLSHRSSQTVDPPWWGRRFRLQVGHTEALFRGLPGWILIAISFLSGRYAILPVAGTAFLLLSASDGVLSCKPLVVVGRMSYSLYLWHWPVFSLVDYQFCWQPPFVRLVLKVSISVTAAALCYVLIERPGRIFLNHPVRRRLAFAALAGSFATLIPLGIAVRNANYLNADARAVRRGGLRFNPGGRTGSMVLMGDSNGSMYGRAARDLATELGLRLAVISVEAGDPLPHSAGRNPQLWVDSLAAVKQEKPDFLLFVCNWSKLYGDRDRLAIALRELKPWARVIVLLTQPPVLPETASREGIRSGNRPPFREDRQPRAARRELNEFVKSLQGDNVKVIDVEPLFSRDTGEIRFVDGQMRLLYQDRDHLSAAGADLVKPELISAMTAGLTASRR